MFLITGSISSKRERTKQKYMQRYENKIGKAKCHDIQFNLFSMGGPANQVIRMTSNLGVLCVLLTRSAKPKIVKNSILQRATVVTLSKKRERIRLVL